MRASFEEEQESLGFNGRCHPILLVQQARKQPSGLALAHPLSPTQPPMMRLPSGSLRSVLEVCTRSTRAQAASRPFSSWNEIARNLEREAAKQPKPKSTEEAQQRLKEFNEKLGRQRKEFLDKNPMPSDQVRQVRR